MVLGKLHCVLLGAIALQMWGGELPAQVLDLEQWTPAFGRLEILPDRVHVEASLVWTKQPTFSQGDGMEVEVIFPEMKRIGAQKILDPTNALALAFTDGPLALCQYTDVAFWDKCENWALGITCPNNIPVNDTIHVFFVGQIGIDVTGGRLRASRVEINLTSHAAQLFGVLCDSLCHSSNPGLKGGKAAARARGLPVERLCQGCGLAARGAPEWLYATAENGHALCSEYLRMPGLTKYGFTFWSGCIEPEGGEEGNADECSPIQKAKATGCADGQREAFFMEERVAGCNGGWAVEGLHHTKAEEDLCKKDGGDNKGKEGAIASCAETLCGPGWHLCNSRLEVADRTEGRGCEFLQALSGSFYATRQSTDGFGKCSLTGTNDFVGCGAFAFEGPDPLVGCEPLDRFSGEDCRVLDPFGTGNIWKCGDSLYAGGDTYLLFDNTKELELVVKKTDSGGGVICCQE